MLHDVRAALIEQAGDLAVRRSQFIPAWFLQELREQRDASMSTRHRFDGFNRVASVPVYLVEKWKREGFDVYTAPVAETVARLKREQLQQYLASLKRI